MKVRIIKSEAWHKGMVGKVFDAKEEGTSGNLSITTPGDHFGNGLYPSDYELVRDGNLFPQPIKIRITDMDQFEKVQKAVFKAGGAWLNGETRVLYIDGSLTTKAVFVTPKGVMTRTGSESTFDDNGNIEHWLDKDGDISISPPQPKTKFVMVEGVKYEVPGGTKYVTRDKTGATVFAWNGEPEWTGERLGYRQPTPRVPGAMAMPVYPYVEPKPEGHLYIEV